jgi:hypothetical protein
MFVTTALVFLFMVTDSLPPSPDLSTVVFPEPPLHVVRRINVLGLGGCIGDITGVKSTIDTKYLTLHAAYRKRHEWTTIRSGHFVGALDLFYDHLHLKPSVSGFILQHQHDYIYTSPRIDFSAPTPWAIVWGQSSLDLWRIDGSHQFEYQTDLQVIFDKMKYKPHFEITGLYTSQRMRAEAAWNMHIRNLHVSVRSPIAYDFPSPSLTIQYRDPVVTMRGTVRSGSVYHTLKSYFDPDLPIAYTTIVPEESLRLSASLTIAADLYHHIIRIDGSYDNWYNKISVDDSFHLTSVSDIQEFGVTLTASDSLQIRSLSAANALSVQYHWDDKELPLIPIWTVQDSIILRLAAFDVAFNTLFRSQHDGVTKTLPDILRMDGELGITITAFRLFFRISNMTDTRAEWCDEFFLSGRYYAGGLTIKHTF